MGWALPCACRRRHTGGRLHPCLVHHAPVDQLGPVRRWPHGRGHSPRALLGLLLGPVLRRGRALRRGVILRALRPQRTVAGIGADGTGCRRLCHHLADRTQARCRPEPGGAWRSPCVDRAGVRDHHHRGIWISGCRPPQWNCLPVVGIADPRRSTWLCRYGGVRSGGRSGLVGFAGIGVPHRSGMCAGPRGCCLLSTAPHHPVLAPTPVGHGGSHGRGRTAVAVVEHNQWIPLIELPHRCHRRQAAATPSHLHTFFVDALPLQLGLRRFGSRSTSPLRGGGRPRGVGGGCDAGQLRRALPGVPRPLPGDRCRRARLPARAIRSTL